MGRGDKRNSYTTHTLIVIGVLLVLLGAGYAAAYTLDVADSDTIIDGVYVASVDISGLTRKEAVLKVQRAVTDFEDRGIEFNAYNTRFFLTAQTGVSPDVAPALWDIDVAESVRAAYRVGRAGNLLVRVARQYNAAQRGERIPLAVQINRQRVGRILAAQFDPLLAAPKETALQPVVEGTSYRAQLVPGTNGEIFLYDSAIEQAVQRLQMLDTRPNTIPSKIASPAIEEDDAAALIPTFTSLMSLPAIIITFDEKKWVFDRAQYSLWFTLGQKAKQPQIVLDPARVQTALGSVQKDVEQEPKNATFLFEDGRVKEFTPAQDGVAIDYVALLSSLYMALAQGDENNASISLAVKRVLPEIATDQVNDLGIKELIGKGTTNFSGSPQNRRHNIRVGVSKISGFIVKPGEEFSALAAIGKIDGEHGFKEELVIKQKETRPEFGGGLCQVSTTLFRATMNAALPVTARRNHSYRVRYYEPPIGKDATIYDPWPDFKFVNDTGHHVLVVGHVDGDNITFEFWGTKDGRTQTQSDPKAYNFIPPPPKKETLTDTLPPGKVTCTEKAHTGATASFTYAITYPSGEVKEQVFNSVYVPWQEVCLKGATPEELLQQTAAGEQSVETPTTQSESEVSIEAP